MPCDVCGEDTLLVYYENYFNGEEFPDDSDLGITKSTFSSHKVKCECCSFEIKNPREYGLKKNWWKEKK